MQDIVYKLVPGLYRGIYVYWYNSFMYCYYFVAEQQRREEFYQQRGEEDPSIVLHYLLLYNFVQDVQPPPPDPIDTATEFSHSHYSRDDDLISLQIEPHRCATPPNISIIYFCLLALTQIKSIYKQVFVVNY